MSSDALTSLRDPSPRRRFLRGAATALAAGEARGVAGAGGRIGVGLIGYGLIGKRHAASFQALPREAEIVAVSDVHAGRLAQAAAEIGGRVRPHADFRRLLEDPDVDAVVVATPDHWHALMTMLACAAGKDVYVEKPATLFPAEGDWMLQVARRTGRVVQVGTQQRSGEHYRRARDLIREGRIGEVVSVRMGSVRNIFPGFGSPPDGPVPAGLDYDMWLGPAPRRAYNPNRSLYHFRWFWGYSGGQMTNLGQHQLDIVDWVLGPLAPRRVSSLGGRYALQDNGETPDTQDALFEFDGWSAAWSHREASRGEPDAYGLEFFGTRGSLGISRSGFRLLGDPDLPPESFIPRFTGHPTGVASAPPPAAPPRFRTEPVEDRTGDGNAQFVEHARHFLECIRSRKTPVSDLESGCRVATLCHLANLSLRLGRSLRWDDSARTIRDDAEAARRLNRPYRSPWNRELRALLAGNPSR